MFADLPGRVRFALAVTAVALVLVGGNALWGLIADEGAPVDAPAEEAEATTTTSRPAETVPPSSVEVNPAWLQKAYSRYGTRPPSTTPSTLAEDTTSTTAPGRGADTEERE